MFFILQCSYCFKEAQYNCCWNANYCNESCQQAHWEEHSTVCMQVHNQIQQSSSSNAPCSRHPSVSTDSQKMMSPVSTEVNPTAFPFVNNAECSNEDEVIGKVSNHILHGSQSQYNDEIQSETSIGMDDSHEYYENVLSITVPEPETFTINEQEIDKHTVVIEHITNTTSALLIQSSSPVITQPHHIIPASSSSPLSLPAQPISPTTPPQVSDHPPSVLHMGNTFSWPYQQQPMAPMSHDFSQTLPLLPQVPALTPTTQSNTFFRVF